MCEMKVTKEELNDIIQRLEDAITVCYNAPENPDTEGYPYAQDLPGLQCKEQSKISAVDVI